VTTFKERQRSKERRAEGGEPAINGTCDGKQNEHKRWQPKGWRNEIYSFFEAVLKLLKSEVQCTKWCKDLRGDYSERITARKSGRKQFTCTLG
jgi:hypothetical protein